MSPPPSPVHWLSVSAHRGVSVFFLSSSEPPLKPLTSLNRACSPANQPTASFSYSILTQFRSHNFYCLRTKDINISLNRKFPWCTSRAFGSQNDFLIYEPYSPEDQKMEVIMSPQQLMGPQELDDVTCVIDESLTR